MRLFAEIFLPDCTGWWIYAGNGRKTGKLNFAQRATCIFYYFFRKNYTYNIKILF
jgi:hypothetical protein